MAKLVFSMNLSLDGYVDHEGFAPDPVLFRHWTRQVRGATASICGRRIYQIMRCWEEDRPGWTPAEHEFAAAWRKQPKWVASRSLASVGPDATLLSGDIGAVVRDLKARMQGRIGICGTILAQSLGALGLIDEYRLYFHPVVLGHGKPFFAGPRPRLRLISSDRIGAEAIRLTYVPA